MLDMKKIVCVAFATVSCLSFGAQTVQGYSKKNGTYVQSYKRTAPNSTQRDNWSSRGNANPYTGKAGYKTPNKWRTTWLLWFFCCPCRYWVNSAYLMNKLNTRSFRALLHVTLAIAHVRIVLLGMAANVVGVVLTLNLVGIAPFAIRMMWRRRWSMTIKEQRECNEENRHTCHAHADADSLKPQ